MLRINSNKRAGKLGAVQIHLLFKCYMCTSGSKWYCHLCNMDNHCHTAQLHCCVEYRISFHNKCCYSFFMHTSFGSNYMVIIIIHFLLQIITNGSMTYAHFLFGFVCLLLLLFFRKQNMRRTCN